MALYRFSIKYLSRRTGGAPVDKAVAYLMREQEYGPAQAHLQYVTRTSPTTRSREDLVHTCSDLITSAVRLDYSVT